MKRKICLIPLLFLLVAAKAQFPYGTTGLLHMPTADMQRDKTFMAGASYLNSEATPSYWSYNNYNYYVNITIFPFLEVAYTCTLNKGMQGGYWPERTWGKFVNQDRQFSIRLRAVKEGQWWEYMPAIVLGSNDFLTRDWWGKGNEDKEGVGLVSSDGNGVWNRWYLAASKHFDFPQVGELGVHVAYLYNNRLKYHVNGPAVGFDFHPAFHKALKFMAEYDARTVNLGLGYSVWKDHINFVCELNQCKYFSGGVYFKVHLK